MSARLSYSTTNQSAEVGNLVRIIVYGAKKLITAGTDSTTSYLTRNAVLCALGKIESFAIHDPDTIRDWGHVIDGCQCMWLALQHNEPDDYIVASGVKHTVRQFVETAFRALDIDLK